MKVCTDACLFGAFINLEPNSSVLDIGSGTGLLSLMLAQRFEQATFTGVEIDQDACTQAAQNVANSAYFARIQMVHAKIQDFNYPARFDTIISNPPFFQEDLKSPTEKKNQAHHAVTLNFEDLLSSIERLLKETGNFFILLPTNEAAVFQQYAARNGWYLLQNLTVRNSSIHKPFRQIMKFSRFKMTTNLLEDNVLDIYESKSRAYTHVFKKLLEPYYLQF